MPADDMISTFFYANPTGEGMTYEQLKARRAMAAALASKGRDYPNTVGKGIFSLGESIGETIRDRRLDAEERSMRKRTAEEQAKNLERPGPPDPAIVVPPVGPPGPAAAPSPRADAATGAVAELPAGPDISRAQMAEALMGGAQGSRPAPPAGMRMASLPSAGTMSDAGQPGLTYGGPQPAGPGASMAEPPDLNPPAPSAPPPMTASGPGATDTPPPAPGTGGGVLPVMAGAAGPQPAVPREMLAQVAMANQGANPDAPGPVPPGGAVPPQMLAQVGGFQGDPVSAAPSMPPRTPPVGVQRGPDGRPIIPPDMQPPTFEDWARTTGYKPKAPKSWQPTEEAEWRRLDKETRRTDLLPEYNKRAEALREQLENKIKSRYQFEKGEFDREDVRQRGLYDKFGEEMRKRADPEDQYRREQASLNKHFLGKVGKPYEKVIEEAEADKKNNQTIVEDQEDKMLVLDAIENGVIVGKWGDFRLNAAKAGAWALNNKVLGERAMNTEMLMSKLAKGVGVAVKDLRPVSEFEVKMGKDIVGANINLEMGSIRSNVMDAVRKNNRALMEADNKSHNRFAGEGPLEKTYETPRADWFDPEHRARLLAHADKPGVKEGFDRQYGQGAAEFVLNRVKLLNAARARRP
jgi:hypothetical protein